MQYPVVPVTEGQLRGCQMTNWYGEKFYSFLGIPFAEPPVGELRFKAPEPVKPWTGIKNCTVDGNQSYQRNVYTNIVEGSEDCLQLSVFTKNLPGEAHELKPVLAWIYGGGFISGSNSTQMYGPEFLLTEDIVLVSINYRVGFLGFLHLNDTSLDVPGNAGLKDQQLALKWIQKNIKNFNGNPENVTIFGESAGGASVHYHIVSPSSNGLFHKAILQSGCLLNFWTSSENYSIQFAQTIKETVTSENEALEVLRSLPIDKLFSAQEKFHESLNGVRVIGPNVEKPNKTAVITSTPTKLLASGQYNKVPILLGYNNKEGILTEFPRKFKETRRSKPFDKSLKFPIEILLPPDVDKDDPKCKPVLKKILETYLYGPLSADKYLLATDYYVVPGIIASAKHHAKTSSYPVYLYRVTLDAGLNIFKRMTDIPDSGAGHGDELGYLFNVPLAAKYIHRGKTEKVAIKRFVKLWTNFAKTGNPTPTRNDLNVTWKPVDDKDINFLNIGTELTLHINPEPERIKVWKEIYQLSPSTASFL